MIKLFNTSEFIDFLVTNNKGIFNHNLPTNSAKIEEFIKILENHSKEIGSVTLSEIIGTGFEGDQIITIADSSELISNEKVLRAYFESCHDSHINAVARFIFQSENWKEKVGLNSSHNYTAYNTGSTGGLDQNEVVASGRQDFTITDENVNTCAISQNKFLRTGHSAGRTTYLAELARDLVSTQGFSVPGYNTLTLLNHDASEIGILPSVTGANITYIGVFGGITNPSSGVPKLGQLSEWAMSKAHQGEGQVTNGPHLVNEVELESLREIARVTSFPSSKITDIPSNLSVDETIIRKVHSLINSNENPLKFLLELIRVYISYEKVKSIKSVGYEPTLDLRVEDEHNFIADGIVVHNTGVQRSGASE